ncbi:MAG: (4Fe-4S)-binding protein [Candidatus Thorarchaeota archaeon SMTZ-45]|nr:MAG: (4Fe-4S)-binding protein [Candidatus Thorarchaeota archaeon SMTZ-45]
MTNEVAVISGKGGTGKTTIAAAFAAIASNIVMADCDVDAPDLHILLQPNMEKTEEFISSKIALIDEGSCTYCNLCQTHCRFDAVDPPDINSISCEGCGVCEYICPERAIMMRDKVSGHIHESSTHFGPMVHAKLLPGEGNSGKLVTEVRKRSVKFAERLGNEMVLIDGSPGIGCPVIATVSGLQLGIVVTEPTLSGIHDLKRVLDLMKQLWVRPAIIINKYDLNLDNSRVIERFCLDNSIEILGKLPFDTIMTESMIEGMTLPEYSPKHNLVKSLQRMWKRIENMMRMNP